MKNLLWKQALAATLVGLSLTSLYAANREPGNVQVTVVDENGNLVNDANVYIFGKGFIGGKVVKGSETFELPAGDYKISSAVTRKTRQIEAAAPENIDRYAS